MEGKGPLEGLGLKALMGCQDGDFVLQVGEETGRMCAVHLDVVELEGYRQCPFPQMPSVLAPYQKRIIEYAAVHADCSVYVILCESGCADNHTVGQVVIPAAFGNLLCHPQVVRLTS